MTVLFDVNAPPATCSCDAPAPARWYAPSLAACVACGGLFQLTPPERSRPRPRSSRATRKWDPVRRCYRPFGAPAGSLRATRKWDRARGAYRAFRPFPVWGLR